MPKKKPTWMPQYVPNDKEIKARNWCIKNNIRISPLGIKDESNKWKIGINIGEYKKHEKPKVSPNIYDRDTVWIEYYNFCKYYYDKYR